MKVIKRDGSTVEFDRSKIENAIRKANAAVDENERIEDCEIVSIADYIASRKRTRLLVEDIQDMVEHKLMEAEKFTLAKAYIIYRYSRALVRKANTTDESILSLIQNSNKDVMEENSNKNAVMASTQRDLIAGEVSKDLTRRMLLPDKISKAHEEGILHFHDADLFSAADFQLLLGKYRRYAGQRHCHERKAHRISEEFSGGLHRHDSDYRGGGQQSVRRSVGRCVSPGKISETQLQ